MTVRLFRAIWTLHRWLGLAAGLVLLVSAATGPVSYTHLTLPTKA